jgi:23S rRNA (adenine2503-C2)-methyltransferase
MMGGAGKARAIWKLLRRGMDPLLTFAEEEEEVNGYNEDYLSASAKVKLMHVLSNHSLIPGVVVEESASSCLTRKVLIRLEDRQTIEAVLIPSLKFERTTLCVSTQIGCDRGCSFCLTGTMGLVRNLTADEIIAQVILAQSIAIREKLPPMTNVVFMGMGDAGRNIAAVDEAVRCLIDRDRMSLPQNKITVSTVGPSPEAFMLLAQIPATIAWSLHSPDDGIRKYLVPSTKHSTIQLRDSLLEALLTRSSPKLRTIMIAITLIDGINDSVEDASKVAEFIEPMMVVTHKIVVDLIPYNDNQLHGFRRPSIDRVNAFQQVLKGRGLFCAVRVTRGDAESSACGMLATKRAPKRVISTAIDCTAAV